MISLWVRENRQSEIMIYTVPCTAEWALAFKRVLVSRMDNDKHSSISEGRKNIILSNILISLIFVVIFDNSLSLHWPVFIYCI